MAFQRVPNTAEIDVIYTLNAITVQNVFYAEFAAGYALADLQTLADAIDLNLAASWLPDQPPEALYDRTEVRGLNAEFDFAVTQNANAGPGTHVSSTLPNNVTLSIKKISGLTGRSARGRTYWIGIPENQMLVGDENQLQPAYVDLVVADVDFVRQRINLQAGWAAVLVSRFAGGEKRAEGITFPWTGSVAVNTRVDTQRARLS
jgi:hypothetical protein